MKKRKLTRGRILTAGPTGIIESEEPAAELYECLEYFTNLWNERVNADNFDLISMLARRGNPKYGPLEYLGNLVLLIVGNTHPKLVSQYFCTNLFRGMGKLKNNDLSQCGG